MCRISYFVLGFSFMTCVAVLYYMSGSDDDAHIKYLYETGYYELNGVE